MGFLKKKSKKKSNLKGVTLIGLLVGMFIMGTSLLAGMALMSRNIKLASVAKNEITAAALAEEGVELLRNIRDSGDNWCIKNSEPLDGFSRIQDLAGNDQPDAVALDYKIETFKSGNPSGVEDFDDSSGGICWNEEDKYYETCSLSNGKFIRKIQVLDGDYSGPNGGEIEYRCHEVADKKGIMVVSTVYWSEAWEDFWPEDYEDDALWSEKEGDKDTTALYRTRVVSCLYDWRTN